MKKLIFFAPLLFAGCATNYDAYVEANIKVAEARAKAEGERYKAMAAIAANADASAKVAAVMSMALGHQVQQAQQQIAPPKSAADTTLQAIATILPSVAQIYGINRQVALGMEQVRGNVAIQQSMGQTSVANTASTNSAFTSIANTANTNAAGASVANTQSTSAAFINIAGKIQAPAANVTTTYNPTQVVTQEKLVVVKPEIIKVDPLVVEPVIVDQKVVNPVIVDQKVVNPVVVNPVVVDPAPATPPPSK
ncbi:MAG: hypothetical protein EBR82_81280 [Caulobacteraceae bacterium]|nr:hypothetical protein [Caulobacteraceae bacterium]